MKRTKIINYIITLKKNGSEIGSKVFDPAIEAESKDKFEADVKAKLSDLGVKDVILYITSKELS